MSGIELIHAYRFCPRCGDTRFRVKDSQHYVGCEGCGYQHFINSVLAVGVFIRDAQGRLLLIRRLREPSKGKLGIPGGFSDAYESAEMVARREVREEVNLELGPLRYITSHPNRYLYQGLIYPTVDIFFAADALAWDQLRALEDVEELVFRDPREIVPEELAFDSLRVALKEVLGAGV